MPFASSVAHKAIVASLKQRVEDVLEPILSRGGAYALLDFPNYANVGDSAIWLGEQSFLRGIGASISYTCDIVTYSQEDLARLTSGTILLQGGGNLGDLWPDMQHFREAVIRAFPDRKILQLPQSIHFAKKANLERARAVFNAHPDLTLLLRDERSLQFARNEFRAKSLLCPDMAFALGPLDHPEPPTHEVVWLSRTDIESSRYTVCTPEPGVHQTDWLEDDPSALLAINNFLTRRMWRRLRIECLRRRPLSRTYDPLARQRLVRGCKILSRGKAVVTDRLHGHILSLLMGIPHVLLDNNNGKLRSFYETWTKGSALAVWADAPEEALTQGLVLARNQRSTI